MAARGQPARPSLELLWKLPRFTPPGCRGLGGSKGPQCRPRPTNLRDEWAQGRPGQREGIRIVLAESTVACPHLQLLAPSRDSGMTGKLGAGDLGG